MRIFLQVLGVLFGIAMFIFFILGIWTGDLRWAGTSFAALAAAFAAFAGADSFPEHIPHNERCSGC